VLPELPKLRLEIDEHHRHKDVYEHTLTCLSRRSSWRTRGPDLVLRLAALLHDIGKPRTRKFEPGGGVSFHHHELVGAKMVKKRMRALKYSKEWWTTSPSWSSCTCASTATARASGPTRRCAATSATPGRCSTGCTS
jgi:putative nucleotidyltransferase with HDIG domain